MAWLQFEAMGFPRVMPAARGHLHRPQRLPGRLAQLRRPPLPADGARSATAPWFSKPGNGICHQVHIESFTRAGPDRCSAPTATRRSAAPPACWPSARAASTSRWRWAAGRTPSRCRAVVRVWLTGRAPARGCTAKDVILELLRRYTVRGGSGKIFEYGGPGRCRACSLPQRMTIANMGAELTLTTSVFPSRRGDALVLRRSSAARRTGGRCAADPDARVRRADRARSVRASSRSSRCPARRTAWCR